MQINGEPWTLGGLLLAAAPVLFVVWLALVFVLAPRWGTTRSLSSSEAARVAINPAETGYVDRMVSVHGPAAGKEWKVQYSIGDLRDAWQQRDYGRFFGMPAMGIMLAMCFELVMVGGWLLAGREFWLLVGAGNIIILPIILLNFFAMWAAVYTKLE